MDIPYIFNIRDERKGRMEKHSGWPGGRNTGLFSPDSPKRGGKRTTVRENPGYHAKTEEYAGYFGPFSRFRQEEASFGWVSRIFVHLRQREKLEFVEVSARPEQHCHSEPVRRLVWESPSNFGRPIVIQTVLCTVFWNSSTRSGASNREIATPMCATFSQ